ncbi:MAG: carboxypeptidase regulatory-like domain-containing protein [Acidobacteria bacterium]|nr:carboxypeptidase regulatory-like domain-containing protein [Acidobacteriota bacterium]
MRIGSALVVLWLLIIAGGFALIGGSSGSPSAESEMGSLSGTVSEGEAKAMEGVAVSARAGGKSYTTSVFTDSQGQYRFPLLESGDYLVWAQAVGYREERRQLKIAGGEERRQDFSLSNRSDFGSQLSGTEWMNSLPENTPEDRRMKRVLRHSCGSCHVMGIVLQNRFDAPGWRVLLQYMERTSSHGILSPTRPPYAVIRHYEEDLVNYLARVRGPQSSSLNYKPMPRATGEATRIVVTEYDIPPVLSHHGSFWSEGTPSSHGAKAAHDVSVDAEGNVWFSDTVNPNRTIGKLDPKTGRVSDYSFPGKDGLAVRSHGIVVDQSGSVWFTNLTEGTLDKFDPRTEKFQRFPLTKGHTVIGGQVVVDSKGYVWGPIEEGATRLNPQTGEYQEFHSPTEGGGSYGITVDAKDQGWFTAMARDFLGKVNPETGKVEEIKFEPLYEGVREQDRKVLNPEGVLGWYASAIYQKGPRRPGADRRGTTVWSAQNWEGLLAKVDINTLKVTEYLLHHRDSQPYAVVVDKNHMVWINLMNSDRVARFDPFKEKFTEFPLPSIGTETRHVEVDDRTDPPTVWLPYYRTNKIARIQFR